MGMAAYVTALGHYHPVLGSYLGIGDDDKVITGTLVMVDSDHCVTSESSRYLASALGITDPWDFNQHFFDYEKIDFDVVGAVMGIEGVEWIRVLGRAGFRFCYRPNG